MSEEEAKYKVPGKPKNDLLSKGNLNRIWLVVGAINNLPEPTLINITNAVGMPKPSVADILKKLLSDQIPWILIEKKGSVYKIKKWSDSEKIINQLFKDNACKVG